MSELHALSSEAPSRRSGRVHPISLEVAGLAFRLSELLDGLPSLTEELPGGLAFLEAYRAAVLGPEPVQGTRGTPRGDLVTDGPLGRIVSGLGLSRLEQHLVVLSGLPEEHEGFGSILSTLHPEREPRPTAGLAVQLLRPSFAERGEVRTALTVGSLIASGALSLDGSGPFFTRSLVPAPALWPVLHGLELWPEGLRVRPDDVATAGLETWLAEPDSVRARRILERGEPWTVVVCARTPAAAGKRGAALVHAAGGDPARLVMTDRNVGELERIAAVHCLARGLVPVVEMQPTKGPNGPRAAPLVDHPGPVVTCGASGVIEAPAGRRLMELRVEPSSAAVRVRMWRELLPELSSDASGLAAAYRVDPTTAREVAEDARGFAVLDDRPVDPHDVSAAVRSRTSAGVTEGATLRTPVATWDDLVLAEDRMCRLREAVDRVRHQARVLDDWGFLAGRPGARGVRMLLSGPPGTGKTLSAEVVAGALGVDLMVADVSRLVSKWIGETEKQLARIFDAAEKAHAVLLFDEADGLFARRTEIADSNSRYANLETAYLLARMERFEGLTVLSTNLRRNVDTAFLRRLEFVIEYQEPRSEERRALWECHLPEEAPLDEDVDLDVLAGLYPMVGGHIRNAAVAGAFLAAADGCPIRQEHLVRAVRREYAKAGRAFPGAPSSPS